MIHYDIIIVQCGKCVLSCATISQLRCTYCTYRTSGCGELLCLDSTRATPEGWMHVKQREHGPVLVFLLRFHLWRIRYQNQILFFFLQVPFSFQCSGQWFWGEWFSFRRIWHNHHVAGCSIGFEWKPRSFDNGFPLHFHHTELAYNVGRSPSHVCCLMFIQLRIIITNIKPKDKPHLISFNHMNEIKQNRPTETMCEYMYHIS